MSTILHQINRWYKRADSGDSGAAAKSYFQARLENPN